MIFCSWFSANKSIQKITLNFIKQKKCPTRQLAGQWERNQPIFRFALSASCNTPEKLMSARSAISFRQLGIDRVFLAALLRILPRLKSRECGGQIIQHFHYSPLPIQLLRYCLYFPLWFFLFHSSCSIVYPPEQGGRCWCCNHKSPRRGTCPFRG